MTGSSRGSESHKQALAEPAGIVYCAAWKMWKAGAFYFYFFFLWLERAATITVTDES